jgi:hypothetical protein
MLCLIKAAECSLLSAAGAAVVSCAKPGAKVLSTGKIFSLPNFQIRCVVVPVVRSLVLTVETTNERRSERLKPRIPSATQKSHTGSTECEVLSEDSCHVEEE